MTSVVVALWAGSFLVVMIGLKLGLPIDEEDIPGVGDMATILFGASSLALILFSLLVGGIAIIGWQSIKEELRKAIEASTHERINLVEKELRGRVLAVIGFMIGSQNSNPEKLHQDEYRSALSEAVWYLQKGYDILKDLEGRGKYMALNNLVYYSCLYGDELKRDYLLKQARVLKELGQELNWPTALLTYCRVILQWSPSIEDLRDARAIASATLRMNLTERQKKEATFYVASLTEKTRKETGGADLS